MPENEDDEDNNGKETMHGGDSGGRTLSGHGGPERRPEDGEGQVPRGFGGGSGSIDGVEYPYVLGCQHLFVF